MDPRSTGRRMVLVMVIDGIFHKTFEGGLIGNIPQYYYYKLSKMRYILDSIIKSTE